MNMGLFSYIGVSVDESFLWVSFTGLFNRSLYRSVLGGFLFICGGLWMIYSLESPVTTIKETYKRDLYKRPIKETY